MLFSFFIVFTICFLILLPNSIFLYFLWWFSVSKTSQQQKTADFSSHSLSREKLPSRMERFQKARENISPAFPRNRLSPENSLSTHSLSLVHRKSTWSVCWCYAFRRDRGSSREEREAKICCRWCCCWWRGQFCESMWSFCVPAGVLRTLVARWLSPVTDANPSRCFGFWSRASFRCVLWLLNSCEFIFFAIEKTVYPWSHLQ